MGKLYKNIVSGIFISRPNRFVAQCEINGKEEIVHVKNTGRCKELLVSGTKVFLEKSDNQKRKTMYDIVSVFKGDMLINMDSFAPNIAVKKWLEGGGLFDDIVLLKSESTYKNSRFDFYFERKNGDKAYLEVKGVTLENDGVAMFPDAPTIRGTKHINELIDCVRNGYKAYVVFVVQMNKVKYFTPYIENDVNFAKSLNNAVGNGVTVLAYDCDVSDDDMIIKNKVSVRL